MASLAASPERTPTSSVTLAERAFNLLRADILAAKLKPGDKMHVERLREIYGLGATPLREALSKLTSLDLVTATGQRGFCVAPVSSENLLDITKTRAWIEAIALRASIAAGDRHWEAEVLAAAHRLKRCPKRDGDRLSDEWYRENREFHDALAARCGSPQLVAFRGQLYDLSDRYRRMSVQYGLAGRDFDAEHQRIVDAALARDADAAIAHTIDHFVETTRVILVGDPKTRQDAERIVAGLRRDIAIGNGGIAKLKRESTRADRRRWEHHAATGRKHRRSQS
jgi:GntR family carbon starvation induced transcriptional regulator